MTNRWWEYYVLRYFVGTIVGAVVIVFLAQFPHLSPGLSLTRVKAFSDFGIKELPGLAALGFAYCYVASAPMLLLHATRAQIGLSPLRVRWLFWVASLTTIALAYAVIRRCLSIHWWSFQGAGLAVFLGIVGTQIATIIAAHCNRFEAISRFYTNIARARSATHPSTPEFVQSYRHLREHGNAMSILALEFALALVLASAPRCRWAALATVFWFLPSTYSWFIASLLESRLARGLEE